MNPQQSSQVKPSCIYEGEKGCSHNNEYSGTDYDTTTRRRETKSYSTAARQQRKSKTQRVTESASDTGQAKASQVVGS